MKKKIPLLLTGFITFLLLIRFGVLHPTMADGDTFSETGRRILSGNYQAIYDPITGGGGPYIYVPYAALIFAVLELFTIKMVTQYGFNIYAAISVVCLPIIFYILSFLKKLSLRDIGYYTLILSLIYFFEVIWESVYLGQIDIVLLLLLLLSFIVIPKSNIGHVLFGLVLVLKPQFLVLFFIKFKQKCFFKSLMIAGSVNLLLLAIFICVAHFDFTMIIGFFHEFIDKAHGTSLSHDPVNQSLSSALNRILYAESYGGRYWPDLFQGEIYTNLGLLRNGSHIPQYIFLSGYFLAVLISYLKVAKKMGPQIQFILFLSLLPSIFPLFWQVHSVYLLPVFSYLIYDLFSRQKYKMLCGYLALSSPFLMTNYLIFGGKCADMMLSFGATWIFATISFFTILLSFKTKDSNCLKNEPFSQVIS